MRSSTRAGSVRVSLPSPRPRASARPRPKMFRWLAAFVLLCGRAATQSCTEETAVLDFFTSCQFGVNHSNLGGVGPDSGREELRFSRIGTYNGEPFDLSITVLNTTLLAATVADILGFAFSDPAYTPANSANNGCAGKFGQVNLRLGYSVTLLFQFRHHTTDEPVILPGFSLTFYDIDASAAANEVRVCCCATVCAPESRLRVLIARSPLATGHLGQRVLVVRAER